MFGIKPRYLCAQLTAYYRYSHIYLNAWVLMRLQYGARCQLVQSATIRASRGTAVG